MRAATEGRVLVLEGIEKAERNVLPVLNNLLENREMHLEDGRLLIPASRYDQLLKVIFINDNTYFFGFCNVFTEFYRNMERANLTSGSWLEWMKILG